MHLTHQVDDEEVGLTASAKKEDNDRRLQHDQPHNRRGSTDSDDVWEEARRLGKRAFIRKTSINATLIGLW